MTVCIGALCADPEKNPCAALVIGSDRMVTWGIEFEHEVPKMNFVTEKSVMLLAGDALRGAKLVREVKAVLPQTPTIQTLATTATERYTALRDAQVELDQFRPRGLTRERFYKGESPLLTGQTFFGIDNYVMTYNFNVEALVGGVDDLGSHLFILGHPAGSCHNMGQIGYHAIGSGGAQALQSLIGFSHSSFRTLGETVFAVYVSKRRAEVSPGVGKDTDLAIIDSKGIKKLQQSDLDKLEKLYKECFKPAGKEVVKDVNDMLAAIEYGKNSK